MNIWTKIVYYLDFACGNRDIEVTFDVPNQLFWSVNLIESRILDNFCVFAIV